MSEKIEILEETLGTFYRSRDELLFKCPFCGHHKRKLSINLNLDVFKCWICNTRGGIGYIVKRFASAANKRQWSLLSQAIDMSESLDILAQLQEPEEKIKQIVDLPHEYICLAQKNLPHKANQALKYLEARGITRRDILFYKIGFCPEGEYRNRIIFPSFDLDGDCNYFIARTYKDDWLKYKNPPASKNVIFNELLVDWSGDITLVEGIFDAVKTQNSIPLMGSTLSTSSVLFTKLVNAGRPIYIGLDDDVLQKTLRVIQTMIEYGLEVYQMNTQGIEDLGSLNKEQVKEIKKSSLPMTFENVLELQWRING